MTLMTSYLAGLLTGILVASAGGYFANKYTDERRGKEKKRAVDSDLQYATEKMPELIAEMRDDLAKYPLCREFIILSKKWSYNADPNKVILSYYFEEHDSLTEKVEVLKKLGFIDDITFNKKKRYSMKEKFVILLKG